jgi:tetratricopeptide (TPR) repeat protein
MKRVLGFVLASILLATTSGPAWALTQEEVLQRRLDKMRQADSKLQEEERNQQDRASQLPASITEPQAAKPEERLAIPNPPKVSAPAAPASNAPSPEPRKSVWGSATTTATTTPPAPRPVPAAPPAVPPQGQAQEPQTVPAEATAPRTENREPKKAAALAAKAAKAAKTGDHKAALALIDQAIAADPADPDLRNNRGNILANSGKPKNALADYDRAIAMKASDPAFFTNRGLAHEQLGNPRQACTDYQTACDLGDCTFLQSYKAEGHCQ